MVLNLALYVEALSQHLWHPAVGGIWSGLLMGVGLVFRASSLAFET